MNLITANHCDFLTPTTGVVPYYDKFISQYTCIVTATLVSQCNLMPEMFDEHESVLDAHIDNFIKNIPESALRERKLYRARLLGAMLDAGDIVQEKENRTFFSENFILQAESTGISSRCLVIKTLNSYAYLNYFFLLEETLRDAYLEVIDDDSNNLGGIRAISYCLQRKLRHSNQLQQFEIELRKRSKFFKNFNSLSALWELLNFIRNRQAHYNSMYDTRAQDRLSTMLEAFLQKNSSDELLTANVMFNSEFEKIIEDVNESGQLVFNDTLENLIRNTSVSIMESLYVIESSS
ncbi:hypothetical protein [Vibrio owensii]|uniref:hypothetical protein n=1 Tax=Vibrio owensii TaxID=696485 RepID=UPI0018F25921|nr:hypothetical protein [Vibrio owensii]